MVETEIDWDLGTAYDFFLSLKVLHEPDTWQLRGAWAAGVRSRLSPDNREILGGSYPFISLPAGWIVDLESPKNGASALSTLSALPARDRLRVLTGHDNSSDQDDSPLSSLYQQISSSGTWTESDVDETYGHLKKHQYSRKHVQQLVQWWADLEGFGQQILEALREYYEVFFAEEEERIAPVLAMALERAKELSTRLSPQALVEELALGLRYESFPDMLEIVLVPSFWATPLMVFGTISDKRHLILFGGRPDDVSLVPGEVVPDSLYRGLKALADPTRLRILRYLIREPHTPAQLARKLRLRPPTVVHHLHTLRIAQMVEITLTADEGRRYTVRAGAVENVSVNLDRFLFKMKDEQSSLI